MTEATNTTSKPEKASWKRLIVLCDGTGSDSTSGDKATFPTNVTRISRALSPYALVTEGEEERRIEQVIFYQPGVGTQSGQKLRGGAYGLGVSGNIRAAYGFLAHNYEVGDEIIFFGFSRGAFTARSIAGLVTNLGLLTKLGMDYFPQVYAEYYSRQWFQDNKGVTNPEFEFSDALKKTLDHAGALVPEARDAVKVVGVWDTVEFHAEGWISSALSKVNSLLDEKEEKMELHNAVLSPKVRYAYHALALDEQRSEFKPTLWQWPTGYTPRKDRGLQEMRQVWFSGVHSDIGGSFYDSRLSDITLAWMIAQCSKHKQLAFIDEEPRNPPTPYKFYLLENNPQESSKTPGEEPRTKWGTAQGPSTANPDAGSFLSRVVSTALNMFFQIGAGDREPLQLHDTRETIHRSIEDRDLKKWPCGPLRQQREKLKWPLTRPGAGGDALIEADVDPDGDRVADERAVKTEEKYRGRIRPAPGQKVYQHP